MSHDSTRDRNRIAVVDDEEDLAYLFGEALKSRGYAVDVFTGAHAASEKIKLEHLSYSLVLTDVRMPNLSGIDLGKQILKVDDKIKIILISIFELIDDINLQYVKKPIEMTELIEIVGSKLNGKT
jgi:DNA-binding NtrC family response regulator